MSKSLEVDFALETVEQMVKRHGVSLNKETVIHSDQGAHYTSLKFIYLVESQELRRSMSRRGKLLGQCAPGELLRAHEGRTGGRDPELDILYGGKGFC